MGGEFSCGWILIQANLGKTFKGQGSEQMVLKALFLPPCTLYLVSYFLATLVL